MVDPNRPVTVVDAIAAGLISEAAQLTFEYMASTCAEVGWPIPQSPSDLPESLQVEVVDLAQSYSHGSPRYLMEDILLGHLRIRPRWSRQALHQVAEALTI